MGTENERTRNHYKAANIKIILPTIVTILMHNNSFKSNNFCPFLIPSEPYMRCN